MTAMDLSPQEQRVLESVSRLESAERSTYFQDVVQESGLDEAQVREALSALTGRHNLVSETGPGDAQPDLGSQYLLRQQA